MTAGKFSETATTTRVWQRMLSGRRLDLLDPSPLDIEIADIVHERMQLFCIVARDLRRLEIVESAAEILALS